jgi:hypothetical protein
LARDPPIEWHASAWVINELPDFLDQSRRSVTTDPARNARSLNGIDPRNCVVQAFNEFSLVNGHEYAGPVAEANDRRKLVVVSSLVPCRLSRHDDNRLSKLHGGQ